MAEREKSVRFEIAERYWLPADSEHTDDFLWLLGEDELYGKHLGLTKATETAAPRCLVLLGEMGIGKSKVLESMEKERRSQGSPAPISRSFREFQAPAEIRHIIDEAVKNRTTLYLDALDELHLVGGMDAFRGALRNLAGTGSDWQLRISCRYADWDGSLVPILEDVWQQESVRVVRLAPLRQQEVRQAAQDNGIDPAVFLVAVREKDLEPFARLPLTLLGLLAQWMHGNELKAKRWEIFESACVRLAEETTGGAQPKTLSGDKLVRIAAGIALSLSLTGKDRVRLDGSTVLLGIPRSELRWCAQSVNSALNDAAADTVLLDILTNTALFRGNQGAAWFVHQAYQDFLAALCLAESKTGEQQWLEVLTLAPHTGPIIPQFRGIAGWLCAKFPSFMERIAQQDFVTLLLAGIDTLTAEVRRAVVEQLLLYPVKWQVAQQRLSSMDPYKLLKYDGLAAQLKGAISKGCDEDAFIEIAKLTVRNSLRGMSSMMLEIALSTKKSALERSYAAAAVAEIGSEEDRMGMKAILDDLSQDMDDQLKAYALEALWKEKKLITAKELFSFLTPPKRSNFYGAYSRFVQKKVVQYLDDAELPEALEWIMKRGVPYNDLAREEITKEIIARSCVSFLTATKSRRTWPEWCQSTSRIISTHRFPLIDNQISSIDCLNC